MKWSLKFDRRSNNMLSKKLSTTLLSIAVLMLILNCSAHAANDNPWVTTATVQGYWQTYDGTTTRDDTFNAGAYLMGDYLESTTVGIGYNFNLVNLNNNADIVEHIFYATGRHHWFVDALSGKLTFRLDLYGGQGTLEYRTNNPPTGMKKNLTPGSTTTTRETTSISAIQPILSYINFNKTLYLDLGYAYSRYDENPDTTVTQLTPSAGFGWNESYDWLQLRAYLISLDETDGNFDDDRYQSLELSYTHWFADGTVPQLEFLRASALSGERVLAVDPDAAAIHSTADKQTASLSVSAQWKISQSNRLLALINSSQYENDVVAEKYDGLLFYLNLQHQW